MKFVDTTAVKNKDLVALRVIIVQIEQLWGLSTTRSLSRTQQ
jgi:hypothetical protein